MRLPIVNPLVDGTRVFEVNGNDKTAIGFSTHWTVKTNRDAKPGLGCPSFIDQMVVGDTGEEARRAAAAVPLVQEPGVASSSFSSHHVKMIRLQPDGSQYVREVENLLVAKWFKNLCDQHPTATEIWVSDEPFLDQDAV